MDMQSVEHSEEKTALHCAAYCGSLEMVQLICEHDLSILDALDMYAHSALRIAAANRWSQIFEYLLSKSGANALERRSRAEQWTCLHEASRFGGADIVHTILNSGVDVASEARDAKGLAPLALAVAGDWHELSLLAKASP
jgi:ankyrin repeat protein